MPKPSQQPRTIETTADDLLDKKYSEEDTKPPLNELEGRADMNIVLRDFPMIVGDGITACMRDRTQHQRIDKEIDEWFRNLPPENPARNNALDEAGRQIETARMALDSFYQRFRQVRVGARKRD